MAAAGQYRDAYRLASAHFDKGTHILDWGCGNGHFSRFLLARGHDVTGYSYEPPPTFVMDDNRFHFVPGVEGEPRRLPFADASFDAACSIGVLEHVHEMGGDQPDSILELHRVLRRGGKLLVVHLPNKGSWVEAAVRTARRLGVTEKFQHTLLFGPAEVQRLFDASIWRVVARGRYNVLPRNSLRHLPSRLGDSRMFCGLLNTVDDLLGALLPAVCQNWYIVLQKS